MHFVEYDVITVLAKKVSSVHMYLGRGNIAPCDGMKIVEYCNGKEPLEKKSHYFLRWTKFARKSKTRKDDHGRIFENLQFNHQTLG